MKPIKAMFAVLALSAIALAAVPTLAEEGDNYNVFVKMCEKSPDGMITKEQVMAMVEKAFDKVDTKKMKKINKAQAADFLKEFQKYPGG